MLAWKGENVRYIVTAAKGCRGEFCTAVCVCVKRKLLVGGSSEIASTFSSPMSMSI